MSNEINPASKTGFYISAMNRFRHGGAADSLFVAGEVPDEFFVLLSDAFEQHKPAYHQDAALVTDSVRARWILNRRQRAADQYESGLLERKPNGRQLVPSDDIAEIEILDRYLTTADRNLTRSLQKLHTIKKVARDDERWQFHLETAKKRLEMDVQLFEFRKQREEALAEQREKARSMKDLFKTSKEPEKKWVFVGEDGIAYINQEVAVNLDADGNNVEPVDAFPPNQEVRDIMSDAANYPTPPTKVWRTYFFIGVVPEEYPPLTAEEFQEDPNSNEISKILTFAEWRECVARE